MNWDKVEIQLGEFTITIDKNRGGDYQVSLYGTFREGLFTPDFVSAQDAAIKSVRGALENALAMLGESGNE